MILNLTRAIAHCEEVAKDKEKQVKYGVYEHGSIEERECLECAEEHRQLAHWLMELKIFREGGLKGKWKKKDGCFICDQCGYSVIADDADDFRFCTWCGAKMMEVDDVNT